MFDTFVIRDEAEAKNIKCYEGHVIPTGHDFQTKDLDNALDVIILENYKLYRLKMILMPEDDKRPEALSYTGQIKFYTYCPECSKKYTWKKGEPARTVESTRWVEYVAVFRNGELVFIDPVNLESLEEEKDKMKIGGWTLVE